MRRGTILKMFISPINRIYSIVLWILLYALDTIHSHPNRYIQCIFLDTALLTSKIFTTPELPYLRLMNNK